MHLKVTFINSLISEINFMLEKKYFQTFRKKMQFSIKSVHYHFLISMIDIEGN